MSLVKKFLNDENGATAIEYGLIVGLIAVAIIGVLGLLGTGIDGLFQTVLDKINGVTTPTP